MTNGQLFFLSALIVLGTAIASKPPQASFPPIVEASARAAFGGASADASKALAKRIGALRCMTAPDGCANRIKGGLLVEYDDIFVARVADISFEGHDVATCLGAGNSWICEN